MRKLIKQMFSDGVLPNPSTNMQVSSGEGMNVIVSPGFALCNGCMKLEEAQRTLAVQASSTAYDRIDTVVLRLNDNDSDRICDFYILQGVPAISPVRPALTRTESIWELGLADLFIAKNSSAISNQRITDTRYETARCGVMSSISEFDTETLYQQVQSDLAEFKSSEQAEFVEWFSNLQAQLDEDAATNLQNQIGTLTMLKTEIKTSIVTALNWMVDKVGNISSKMGIADISEIGDGTITGAITKLNDNFQRVVWETPNYTSASTITLSDTEWDYIEIFAYYNSNKSRMQTISVFPGKLSYFCLVTSNGSNIEYVGRIARLSEDKKTVSLDFPYYQVQGNDYVETSQNNYWLPFMIVGHKLSPRK